MTERRPVRADEGFFGTFDAQLGAHRGPHGEPSATDFLLIDLPPIADRFATRFDELPMPVPDRSDYRAVIAAAVLVSRVLVVGHLEADGTVVLLTIDFEVT